jgi:hypothetical protein
VAVVCREVEEGSCEEGEFHCSSGECVDIKKLCNGAPDCSDHSDEDVNRCTEKIAVRLSDQEHYGPNSGLLEVRHKGVWGTVCNENFSEREAKVFCRMLGYDGNATFDVVDQLRPRKGSWPIWITLDEEGIQKLNLIVVCFALNCTLPRHMYRQRSEHRTMPRTRPLGTPYPMQTR